MTPADDTRNSESWLMEAVDRMSTSLFLPFKRPTWRVPRGWPRGVRGGKHEIGQCWPATASKDGTAKTFISIGLPSRGFTHPGARDSSRNRGNRPGPQGQVCEAVQEDRVSCTLDGDHVQSGTARVAGYLCPQVGALSTCAFKRSQPQPRRLHGST
jgi:hypothetical protein